MVRLSEYDFLHDLENKIGTDIHFRVGKIYQLCFVTLCMHYYIFIFSLDFAHSIGTRFYKNQVWLRRFPRPSKVSSFGFFFSNLKNLSSFGQQCQVGNLLKSDVVFFVFFKSSPFF